MPWPWTPKDDKPVGSRSERVVASRQKEVTQVEKAATEWMSDAGLSERKVKRAFIQALSSTVHGLAQVAAGGATFYMALNLSQAVQGAVLRVAASTPLGIPNALGFVTVAGASLVALHVSEAVSTALTTGNLQLAVQSTIETASDPGPAEASAVAFGLALFKCLGGTFGGIAPSLIDNLGAFSRFKASLPATLLYATTEERGVINALGETYGCHSCGRRAGAKYNADHMPPLKYVKKANARLWRRVTGLTVTQRFYPQCKPCSDIQAQVVRADGRFVKYHHPLTVHRYHATGLLLVAGVLCLREYARERTARAALRKAEK